MRCRIFFSKTLEFSDEEKDPFETVVLAMEQLNQKWGKLNNLNEG